MTKPDAAKAAFQDWYAAQYQPMLRALMLVTGDHEVAVEAVAEAFARALERWDRVSSMDSPLGWTYRVALNVARRMGRRTRMEVLLLRRATAPPPVHPDRLEVWDAVSRLPRRQRTAVVLHYFADLPQREVAAVMRISDGTVAATLHAARQRLALALGDEQRAGLPAALGGQPSEKGLPGELPGRDADHG